MALPAHDLTYLEERQLAHEVAVDAGMTCVVFGDWRLPPGYDRDRADLMVRLQTGYPDVPPDMWWFDPPVRLADGRGVPATEVTEQHLGRSWQRWSRHFQPGQWQSGIDGLESYLALIQRELTRCASGVA
jgi:hypothetical protein